MAWDPLSIFQEVVQSILAWTGIIYATQVVGFWLGATLAGGEMCGVCFSLLSLPFCVVAWLLFPQLLIAVGVMLLCWYLPIRYEEIRWKICGAAANFLTWAAVTAWIAHAGW